jgi:hypothetical protein
MNNGGIEPGTYQMFYVKVTEVLNSVLYAKGACYIIRL